MNSFALSNDRRHENIISMNPSTSNDDDAWMAWLSTADDASEQTSYVPKLNPVSSFPSSQQQAIDASSSFYPHSQTDTLIDGKYSCYRHVLSNPDEMVMD
jgi:hypothetical protein